MENELMSAPPIPTNVLPLMCSLFFLLVVCCGWVWEDVWSMEMLLKRQVRTPEARAPKIYGVCEGFSCLSLWLHLGLLFMTLPAQCRSDP